ncbi:nitrilase-related carbon-nitrogen hydrolase [Commensalibacter communis]|uniref:nitrilase-related carbon-nitrogen hydrolase n=1 Tax=Commensalibacter communis TaxID=2972786 RepID=UPI00232EE049|nr:nitrilase-related carbon-nitrogen hydrolase [Commensalibacter communis]
MMNIGSTHALNGKFEVEALSVVAIQILPISAQTMDDVEKNIDQLIAWMDRAAAGFPGFDLFFSPECALNGFGPAWSKTCVDLDGSQLQRLKDKCKELKVFGVFNPLVKEIEGKKACNTAIIINDEGEIVLKYVKTNPWIPGEGTYPGWSCSVVDGPKGSKLAVIICADGDYPEIWREAAVNGANVIIRVSHYMAPWDNAWEITNKAGAYCNQTYVVGANSVGIDEAYSYFGRSMILNPDGTIICEAPLGQSWMIKADLYPQIIDKMREEGVTNNFLWTYKNRGAAHPDFAGKGADATIYKAKK